MPLSSASFHVFPTEKEPLVLSFDLCMKPVLSVAPGGSVRTGETGEEARTGDEDVAWLLSLAFARVLPDLDVGDVGLEDACAGVALVEDGRDDALPGTIAVGHGGGRVPKRAGVTYVLLHLSLNADRPQSSPRWITAHFRQVSALSSLPSTAHLPMPPHPALSVSPTLSSPDALSSFNGQEDTLTADSPVSSSSRDASVDVMDVDERAGSSQESLLLHDPLSRRSLRSRAPLPDKSSLRFRPNPVPLATRSKSHIRGASEDNLRKKVQKHAGSHPTPKPHSERDVRVRELKSRALAIPSTGKTPATVRQRMVMQMVYDEITPYPDEAWVSQLSIIIQRYLSPSPPAQSSSHRLSREYHQVKNWFSNQRQKDARDSRQSPQPSATSNIESSLCKITCDGRDMRIRTSALDVCAADEWSDAFFDEVVMIHNFRLLAKHSQDEARAALLDSPSGTTDIPYTQSRLS